MIQSVAQVTPPSVVFALCRRTASGRVSAKVWRVRSGSRGVVQNSPRPWRNVPPSVPKVVSPLVVHDSSRCQRRLSGSYARRLKPCIVAPAKGPAHSSPSARPSQKGVMRARVVSPSRHVPSAAT